MTAPTTPTTEPQVGVGGHTPGPWEIYSAPIASAQEAKDLLCEQVDFTSPVGTALYMLNADGKCPAITGCGPTSEANARLIAAAPEMLSALEGAEEFLADSGFIGFTLDEVRAAIAKARNP